MSSTSACSYQMFALFSWMQHQCLVLQTDQPFCLHSTITLQSSHAKDDNTLLVQNQSMTIFAHAVAA